MSRKLQSGFSAGPVRHPYQDFELPAKPQSEPKPPPKTPGFAISIDNRRKFEPSPRRIIKREFFGKLDKRLSPIHMPDSLDTTFSAKLSMKEKLQDLKRNYIITKENEADFRLPKISDTSGNKKRSFSRPRNLVASIDQNFSIVNMSLDAGKCTEVEYLHQLCQRLMEEQISLKQKIENQEGIIQQLRRQQDDSRLSIKRDPTHKQNHSDIPSFTQSEASSPYRKRIQNRESFESPFTFRQDGWPDPQDSREIKHGKFPREVFSSKKKKKPC
jgi:hypothetical protein